VHVIEVDIVGAEAAKAVPHRREEHAPRRALVVRGVFGPPGNPSGPRIERGSRSRAPHFVARNTVSRLFRPPIHSPRIFSLSSPSSSRSAAPTYRPRNKREPALTSIGRAIRPTGSMLRVGFLCFHDCPIYLPVGIPNHQ
jgi:hypothetical protein